MEITDSKSSVSKSTFQFLTGTFMSRITGMVRDLSMAFCFGINPAVSSFLIAFRLSNLLRRLFGEGALLNGFIPFFEAKRRDKEENGALFFRDLFWSLFFILLGFIVFFELIIAPIYFFSPISTGVKEILYMLMIQLPGLLFICLFGLSMALLQCEKNYFIPGVAPVAFNLIWITAVWSFRKYPADIAMNKLSIAVVIAFFLQWVMTFVSVRKYLGKFLSIVQFLRPKLFAGDLKLMIMPIFYGVIGVAAVQVNSAIDILMARFASATGPAVLSYAHRVQQLPIGLFAIAISSALLPPLSRAIKKDLYDDYRSLLQYGLTKMYSILFPGVIAIFVLGLSSINVLYGRGEFTAKAVSETTICLWCYGLGLLPVSIILLLGPAYYARRDYTTPMKASLIAVSCNILFNILFVFILRLPVCFIALSTSISAYINLFFIGRWLQIDLVKKLYLSFMQISILAMVAGVICYVSAYYLYNLSIVNLLFQYNQMVLPHLFKDQFLQFITLTAIFGGSFYLLAYIFRVKEAFILFQSLFSKETL